MKQFIFAICFLLTSGLLVGSCKKDTTSISGNPSVTAFAGKWQGTYTGGDSGTWKATIDSMGGVAASFYSKNVSDTLRVTGSVSAVGAINCSATNGSVFTGLLKDASATGSWINESLKISGQFTGKKF